MIRFMQKQDLEEVYKINIENFTSDAWSLKAFERELELDYSYPFVLEKEGKVIGYMVLWQVYDEANLMTFAVKKEHQGKGYGKELLRYAVEYFKGKVRRITLDVRRSNIKAIKLYQSLGFKINGFRPRYYSDGEDALQMCLELEEEHATDKVKTAQANPV
ncbi:MAG: ribosomal-protein-alanine N-acetyltransferase [Aquificota bacterium]|nr:MAG: ribosomal-protein-alanine N-acetyltransferase [Aquificota bacterium]